MMIVVVSLLLTAPSMAAIVFYCCIIQFSSLPTPLLRFESGNLARAERIGPAEYLPSNLPPLSLLIRSPLPHPPLSCMYVLYIRDDFDLVHLGGGDK